MSTVIRFVDKNNDEDNFFKGDQDQNQNQNDEHKKKTASNIKAIVTGSIIISIVIVAAVIFVLLRVKPVRKFVTTEMQKALRPFVNCPKQKPCPECLVPPSSGPGPSPDSKMVSVFEDYKNACSQPFPPIVDPRFIAWCEKSGNLT